MTAGAGVRQTLLLLEELWRVAHADRLLHKYEEHLIRRIADLLDALRSGLEPRRRGRAT